MTCSSLNAAQSSCSGRRALLGPAWHRLAGWAAGASPGTPSRQSALVPALPQRCIRCFASRGVPAPWCVAHMSPCPCATAPGSGICGVVSAWAAGAPQGPRGVLLLASCLCTGLSGSSQRFPWLPFCLSSQGVSSPGPGLGFPCCLHSA